MLLSSPQASLPAANARGSSGLSGQGTAPPRPARPCEQQRGLPTPPRPPPPCSHSPCLSAPQGASQLHPYSTVLCLLFLLPVHPSLLPDPGAHAPLTSVGVWAPESRAASSMTPAPWPVSALLPPARGGAREAGAQQCPHSRCVAGSAGVEMTPSRAGHREYHPRASLAPSPQACPPWEPPGCGVQLGAEGRASGLKSGSPVPSSVVLGELPLWGSLLCEAFLGHPWPQTQLQPKLTQQLIQTDQRFKCKTIQRSGEKKIGSLLQPRARGSMLT